MRSVRTRNAIPAPAALAAPTRWLRPACQVLTARIDEDACGWFVATVVGDVIGKNDKKKTPTATHVVEYKQKETGLRGLAGKEAQTLTAEKYGPTEWWILLDVA